MIDNSGDFIKQLNAVQVQLQVVRTMLEYVQDDHNTQRPVPSLMTSTDPTFLALLDKYNSLQIQRDRLNLGNTDQNPIIRQYPGQQISNLPAPGPHQQPAQPRKPPLPSANTIYNHRIMPSTIISKAPPRNNGCSWTLSREQDIKQALFIYPFAEKRGGGHHRQVLQYRQREGHRPCEGRRHPLYPEKAAYLCRGVYSGAFDPVFIFDA